MLDKMSLCGFSGDTDIEMVIVPICPCTITPIGSTDFREGIKPASAPHNVASQSSVFGYA
jgi:hypothetical protein